MSFPRHHDPAWGLNFVGTVISRPPTFTENFVGLVAQIREKLMTAIDDLNSVVSQLGNVVSAVVANEQSMTQVIASLQAQVATLPPDQSAAIETAVAQIQMSVTNLSASLPAAPAPSGSGSAPNPTGSGSAPTPTGTGTAPTP